uniref:Uncharacterized protein MANES_01G209800 n=1 Tax=Rhizophora mucronata TaxID=61149 RepID=A0A2P2J131_RHIMU
MSLLQEVLSFKIMAIPVPTDICTRRRLCVLQLLMKKKLKWQCLKYLNLLANGVIVWKYILHCHHLRQCLGH